MGKLEGMIHLPWPPSVNRYWRHNRGRTHIATQGKKYRLAVWGEVKAQWLPKFGKARLNVEIACFPPDRRGRDLDNLGKAVLDALQKAGVYGDDSQIDRLLFRREKPEKPGGITIKIREL